MGKSQDWRKQAQERRARKEAARRRKIAALFAPAAPSRSDPEALIRAARALPIHDCWINPNWQEEGLAHILLSRQQPDGHLVFGSYLVDLLCLGVKGAFCNAGVSPQRYTEARGRLFRQVPPEPCPVPLAHEIIYGALDYAARLGFAPGPDFGLAQHVLEPREALREKAGVEFGRDGKPFFISGPADDVDRIIETLRKRVGEGNFHFLMGGPV